MSKVLQLIFGDWRNVLAVSLCLALAAVLARVWPQIGGWSIVPALFVATWWQSAR